MFGASFIDSLAGANIETLFNLGEIASKRIKNTEGAEREQFQVAALAIRLELSSRMSYQQKMELRRAEMSNAA